MNINNIQTLKKFYKKYLKIKLNKKNNIKKLKKNHLLRKYKKKIARILTKLNTK